MTSRTIYYFLSVLLIYLLVMGACIYMIHYENLSKRVVRSCKTIIIINAVAIVIFLSSCFEIQSIKLSDWVWISEAIACLIVILEIVTITVLDIKDAKNRPKPVQRETFDLQEELLTEENLKICYTQKKKEESFKGTIVFMHPNYYKSDLNGRVWYQDKRKKILLGHIGKYDEISDYFVRAGYHTLRYDHSDIDIQIPLQPVLQRINKVLKEKDAGKVTVFCAGNINDFMQEIVEGLNPSRLICVGITNEDTLVYINEKSNPPAMLGRME